MTELEIIRHEKLDGISMFFDTIIYRTPHFHPEWELIWVTEGELMIHTAGQEAVCRAGELALFHPRLIHAFRAVQDQATILCLQISPKVFARTYPALSAMAVPSFTVSQSLPASDCAELRGMMRQIMFAYLVQKPCFELDCTAGCAKLLSLLLTHLPARQQSQEELSSAERRNLRLSRFVTFVDQNYMRPLTLREFADREGYSVSYLSRFLKAQLNQTFQDYVNYVRFRSACRLISAGERRLIDVCQESGFSDYRYFSACFRKYCGMTPEAYRLHAREAPPLPAQRSLKSLELFYTPQQEAELLRNLS